MIKRLFFAALVVAALVSAVALPAAAQTLAEETVEVRISIPAMHHFRVIDAVTVEGSEFPAPGETKVFSGVGKVLMRSNASWTLNVDAGLSHSSTYDVEVRPSNSSEDWQPLNGFNGAAFSGQGGSHEIRWDIRVTSADSQADQAESLTLGFTASLSQ